MSPIHEAAAVGFERGADDYVASRPGYPAAVLGLLGAELGLGPGADVLDLAAGTGKLTVDLVASGATVTAVEPVAAMRAALEHLLPDIVVLARHPATRGRERFPFPHDTVVHWCRAR